jgi:hypothetical protein
VIFCIYDPDMRRESWYADHFWENDDNLHFWVIYVYIYNIITKMKIPLYIHHFGALRVYSKAWNYHRNGTQKVETTEEMGLDVNSWLI